MIDQGNLINSPQQVIQKKIMVDLCFLKSGKVKLRRTIDQGNLRQLLGMRCNKLPFIVKNLFSTKMPIPLGTIDRKKMSNVTESDSIIWEMFMAATLNAATFMGKKFSTIQSVVKNHESLTLKQMFDVTAQLVNDQEEIHRFDKIQWEKCSWRSLSLIGDETVINLQSTKVYVFSDSVLCLGGVLQHPDSNEGWRNRVAGIRSGKATETLKVSVESRRNSRRTSSQDS